MHCLLCESWLTSQVDLPFSSTHLDFMLPRVETGQSCHSSLYYKILHTKMLDKHILILKDKLQYVENEVQMKVSGPSSKNLGLEVSQLLCPDPDVHSLPEFSSQDPAMMETISAYQFILVPT